MKYAISILTLLFAASMSLLAQNSSSTMGQANPAETGKPTEITGCLKGKSQEYRVVEKNGTTHMLIGDNSALASHVGDEVTLQGYRDNARDASSSMGHGMRYFDVQNITSDNGKCK